MKKVISKTCAAMAALGLGLAVNCRADFTPVADGSWTVSEKLPNLMLYGGYTVNNGQLHYWSGLGFSGGTPSYEVYDMASGSLLSSQTPDIPIKSNGFGDPFGYYDAGSGKFYVGTYDYSGSGLYSYDTNTGTWANHGVFEALYGMAMHGGQVYASGLNQIWNGGYGQDNQIAIYDLSGAGNHDVIIQAMGNSAGVAVDAAGNVYYANYGYGSSYENALYMWTAEQVASVRADLGMGGAGGGIDDLFLTAADALRLCALPSGGNGIAVDAAGNVFVSMNNFSTGGGLIMWNASMGDDYLYLGDVDGWAGAISVEGDFLNGGTLYVTGGNGFSELHYTPVPEPATYAVLAGLAVFALALRRRRR